MIDVSFRVAIQRTAALQVVGQGWPTARGLGFLESAPPRTSDVTDRSLICDQALQVPRSFVQQQGNEWACCSVAGRSPWAIRYLLFAWGLWTLAAPSGCPLRKTSAGQRRVTGSPCRAGQPRAINAT